MKFKIGSLVIIKGLEGTPWHNQSGIVIAGENKNSAPAFDYNILIGMNWFHFYEDELVELI